ncbi:MAG: type II toxin-antitoxin system RelE/ParE family toxin [Hyphomicrobiaceae bacterium]
MTDPAKADLDDIYDYIAADSPIAAERFTTELLADLHRVAGLGYTGVNRGWIRPGLRLHVYGNFCAYFRTDDRYFIVLRIVRGSRDLDAIIFEPVAE